MNAVLTPQGDTCSPVASHAIGVDAATSVASTLKALSELKPEAAAAAPAQ